MAFDAGVYITVVGATLVILSNLGKLAQTTYDQLPPHIINDRKSLEPASDHNRHNIQEESK